MLWNLSDGRPTEYDALEGKDVFDFFRILRAHEKRISQLKPRNGKNNT